MRQYEVCELVFQSFEPVGSFVDINLTATISGEQETITVKGFYAGNGIYKVRFLPKYQGRYSYCTSGIINDKGWIEIEAALPDQHGIVKASDQHFSYEDGTPYYPFGTTVYALSHQTTELIEQTMQTLKQSPFNKLRMCVFPKSYQYNQNEPTYYAFEKDDNGQWNVNKPCMEFWDKLEEEIIELDHMGIQVDLILFHPYDRWGFAELSQKDNVIYLDYLLRRLSAYPNMWWSLANEFDFCGQNKTMEDWEEIEEYVAANDPYHHLLSNHNALQPWDFSRKNITHVSYQTKMLTRIPEWFRTYKKPVVIDECCYEGNLTDLWGCISGREMTARFWRTVTLGGYCTHGETFLDNENEIIWWAKGGKLHGESPERIRFLKEIIYSLPGALEPVQHKVDELFLAEPDQLQEMLKILPKEAITFTKALMRMAEYDKKVYELYDRMWQGHYKDEAFLYYYDLRCCVQDYLELPENHTYKIELLDTWNMSRSTLIESASGKTKISLPGKEGMAVLATIQK